MHQSIRVALAISVFLWTSLWCCCAQARCPVQAAERAAVVVVVPQAEGTSCGGSTHCPSTGRQLAEAGEPVPAPSPADCECRGLLKAALEEMPAEFVPAGAVQLPVPALLALPALHVPELATFDWQGVWEDARHRPRGDASLVALHCMLTT